MAARDSGRDKKSCGFLTGPHKLRRVFVTADASAGETLTDLGED
jgi:hypothetical protein